MSASRPENVCYKSFNIRDPFIVELPINFEVDLDKTMGDLVGGIQRMWIVGSDHITKDNEKIMTINQILQLVRELRQKEPAAYSDRVGRLYAAIKEYDTQFVEPISISGEDNEASDQFRGASAGCTGSD